MPGAAWRPIPVSPSRPRRAKGRAVVFHVAASEATSLFGYFSTASVDSHFYVARDGTIEQYVDTDLQAYASLAANASTISVETQGGVTNPDGEPWTEAQVQSLARIARWAHDTEGVPLTLMPDSRPSSRGVGWHRLGIDPWRITGGEVWSSSRGKLCPGAAKIGQVPRVVALAQGSPAPSPAPGGLDVTPQELHDAVWFGAPGAHLIPQEKEGGGAWAGTILGSMTARIKRDIVDQAVAPISAALQSMAALLAQGHQDLTKDEILATVDQAIRDATVNVDVNVNHGDTPPAA
jgi:hypothetical protein